MSGNVLAVDEDLAAMLDAVFSGYREGHPHEGGRASLDRTFWAELAELGLVRLTGSEDSGGSGSGWADATALMQAAVRHAVRMPLAENDLLAGWLAGEAGFVRDDGIRTVAVLDTRGEAAAVPWAGVVDRIVLVWPTEGGHRIAEVPVSEVRITPKENLIGEPRDDIAVDLRALKGAPVEDEVIAQLQRKCALVRAVQLSAALERSLELSVDHATTRVQFGRPIAKLQAVQVILSDIATETSLALASTESALVAALADGWSADAIDFRIAVARSCAGHAASVVVRGAHQVHGAIGTTREHVLHQHTRAALAWRGEFGSVHSWDHRVSAFACEAGQDGLWDLLSDMTQGAEDMRGRRPHSGPSCSSRWIE